MNVNDTHKSWQAVQVLLFGTTLELCILYLQEAESNESNAVGFSQMACRSSKFKHEVIRSSDFEL